MPTYSYADLAARTAAARKAREAQGIRRTPGEVLRSLVLGSPFSRADAFHEVGAAAEDAADRAERAFRDHDWMLGHQSASCALSLAEAAEAAPPEHAEQARRARAAYERAEAARTAARVAQVEAYRKRPSHTPPSVC